jgi:tRNA A37 methylthiotransferase MiaB
MMFFGFKRYYEKHSKYADQWEWIPPVLDYVDWKLEEIIEEAVSHRADVYAFNSYMWSYNMVKTVAKAVREQLPNAIIIMGGPHQGSSYTTPMLWFKEHPYIDATCTPTEYGEWFLHDTLDQIIEGNLDWANVRNSYHRKGLGPQPNKRTFEFPDRVVETNLDEALRYTEHAEKYGWCLSMLYEGSRGCPYGCTYCEWGGGINSKVIVKPYDIMENDLSYLPLLKVGCIWLTDANFGIDPGDVSKAELLGQINESIGYSMDLQLCGVAKTKVQKRYDILEPLMKSKIIKSYQMSLQTISEEALVNIDRKDISLEENIELARYFIDKYDANVHVELMVGMPGQNMNDFYNECDVVYKVFNKYAGVTRSPMFVLPDSPSADPEYIKKYDIKLVPLGMESEGGEVTEKTGNRYVAIYDTETIKQATAFIPVRAYSFTERDWIEMMFMTDMDIIFSNQHMLKPLIDFMYHHRETPPSKIMPRLYQAMVSVKEFWDPIHSYFREITNGERGTRDWRSMTLPELETNVFRCYLFQWAKYRTELFAAFRKYCEDLLDPVSNDLLDYIENSTFRFDTEEFEWTCQYEWDRWEESKDKSFMPKEQSSSFLTKYQDIVWETADLHLVRTIHTTRITESQIENIRIRKFGT